MDRRQWTKGVRDEVESPGCLADVFGTGRLRKCRGPERPGTDPAGLSTAAVVYKIGVLVDNASPAKANFTAAANLARSQINQGLSQAGINRQFTLVVANYTAGQARATAIDLINNKGVLGIVADTDESTAAVNQLNHDLVPEIVRQVPVTCYQCSSPSFNDPSSTNDAFRDDGGWLFRTFFNASFEVPVQAHMLLDRPNGGDFNGDGHVKAVIYHDPEHENLAFTFAPVLDSMHQGSHSVEVVLRTETGDDMTTIFDSEPDGHFPDAVHLSFSAASLPAALSDYKNHPISPRPPVSTNDNGHRDFLLPALLAAGGEGLHGSSILRVDSSASGPLFRSAFMSANNGKQPEMTSSFLYDAVAAQAIAIGWADSFGDTDPDSIRANFGNISEPGQRVIRPRVADWKVAAQRIKQQLEINYEGASSPLDFDFIEFAGDGGKLPRPRALEDPERQVRRAGKIPLRPRRAARRRASELRASLISV